jgi:hypothetical protein
VCLAVVALACAVSKASASDVRSAQVALSDATCYRASTQAQRTPMALRNHRDILDATHGIGLLRNFPGAG